MQEVSKYVNEGRPDVDLTTDVDTPGLSVWPRLPMAVVRMAASTKAVAVVVAGQVTAGPVYDDAEVRCLAIAVLMAT